MPKVLVLDRSGNEFDLDGATDLTLMEVIRDAGISDLAAICGGCCSCATCHVYVDPQHFNRLGAISEDENDLLDSIHHRRENSRLSCQLRLAADLDGIRVEIAPED